MKLIMVVVAVATVRSFTQNNKLYCYSLILCIKYNKKNKQKQLL